MITPIGVSNESFRADNKTVNQNGEYRDPLSDYEIINQFCKVIEENIKSYKEQNEIDN